ncbi:hypothetical protein AB9K35_08375, partial [Leisingera sp. XS_AS12]|uniref:hypothetical protein n=1 Tax=Leisingera sp. XS_AS12 TaxID=3241294 RepID=UPI0035191059
IDGAHVIFQAVCQKTDLLNHRIHGIDFCEERVFEAQRVTNVFQSEQLVQGGEIEAGTTGQLPGFSQMIQQMLNAFQGLSATQNEGSILQALIVLGKKEKEGLNGR